MKNKYIKFFKKELVFLLILLIVVCISFGMTYANFIYNSENKRAVEMFTGSLKSNIKINGTYSNSITLSPGSSIINLEIESTNEISSYYKLLTNKNIMIYSYEGLTNGAIGSKDKVNVKLYVFNNAKEEIDVSFIVSMGYLTNTLDDVKVKDGYYEIKSMNSEITYDNKKYKVLKVNDDASIDLLSKDTYKVIVSGYDGYNNLNNLLNSKCTTKNSRSINVNDIEGLVINNDENFTNINRLTYYPNSFKYDDNVLIDNKNYSDDEKVLTGYNYSNNVSVKNKKIISNINNEIFKNNSFLLNTNYYEIVGNEINYYVIELNDGKPILKKLYDSNNQNYEITSNVRCIVNIKDIAF